MSRFRSRSRQRPPHGLARRSPTRRRSRRLPDAPSQRPAPARPGSARPTRPQLGQALADLHRGQALPDALSARPFPTCTSVSRYLRDCSTTAPVSHQPIEHLKPSDQPQAPTPTVTAQPSLATAPDLSATVMLPPTPGPQLPTSAAPAATAAPQIGFPHSKPRRAAPSPTTRRNGDHSRHAPDKVASVTSEATTVQYAPASDAAMAAAAATTAPINAAPLPVQVGPSQVVSQIAQHADVIRLPGNRGSPHSAPSGRPRWRPGDGALLRQVAASSCTSTPSTPRLAHSCRPVGPSSAMRWRAMASARTV